MFLSAAKAASLAIDGGVQVQEVDVKEIQRILVESGAYIGI